jgi:hypothetical protein
VIEGEATREAALERYGAFSDQHEWKFRWMLRTQRTVPRVPPRLLAFALRRMENERFVRWSFDHYLNIAPPSFVATEPRPARSQPLPAAA